VPRNLPPASDIRRRDRLWFTLYYLLAFVALGFVVSFRAPSPIDVAGRPFAGQALLYARLLTDVGLFPAYAVLSALLLVAGFLKRELLRAVLVSIVTLIAAWQVSDACKILFHRPRPEYWFVQHEPSFSFPSGHTTLVIAFYGFWTAVAWQSDLPQSTKRWIRIAFALLALGIGWSRLALGAHYITDLVGGYLLGAAMASGAMLVYRALGPVEAGGI
jgi:membrane-associated phospholipid phosphatase